MDFCRRRVSDNRQQESDLDRTHACGRGICCQRFRKLQHYPRRAGHPACRTLPVAGSNRVIV